MPIECIAPAACESGIVRPGKRAGRSATPSARTSSTDVTDRLAGTLLGSSFSEAIKAAMTIIQVMLINPSTNSDAISAQQQPTHQAPCTTPMRRAPAPPSRHRGRRKSSGPRQRRRQASFAGVSW